jgi:hypothetical protein
VEVGSRYRIRDRNSNGTALHDHLLTLPAGGLVSIGTGAGSTGASSVTPTTTTTTGNAPGGGGASKPPVTLKILTEAVKSGGRSVGFTLRSPQNCAGALTGQTVNSYAVASAKRKRHPVSLGTVHFVLKAGKVKTVVLTLSRPRGSCWPQSTD